MDDSAARAVKGVKAVLRVPLDRGAEGVAVVADGYWPAKQGRDALKLEWDTSAVEKVDSEQQLAQYRELAGRPGPRKFDADMAPLATRAPQLEAEFVFPYLAHAPMEPLNCTVRFSDGRAEIWMGTQMPGSRRRRGRERAGRQARAGEGARADGGRRLRPARRPAPATTWSRPARSPRPRARPA